ncbi:MAG: Crp/Fnr family transcriptional regulator [Actinomycetota bacterium]|nr:Crp/Fnr family transcriptional regulator [Actinomycetota bacterium]
MRAVVASQAEQDAPRECESEELLRLLQEAGFGIVRRSYPPREVIHEEEDRAPALYVLTSGMAFLLRGHPTKSEIALGLLKAWDAFGNLAFAQDPARRVVVRALTACEVAKVPGPTLKAAVRRNPSVAMKLITLQDARLTGYEEFVARVWPRKTLIRLAATLLFLCERFPEGDPDAAGPVAIGARFTQEDLAAMVASTRESVGAAMGELRKRGIIDVQRGIVTVLAPEELREVSTGRPHRPSSIRHRIPPARMDLSA